MLSSETVKLGLGGVGAVAFLAGLAVDVNAGALADPFVWLAVWALLIGVGLGGDDPRRDALAAGGLVIAAVAFSLAWLGAATWRTTTFPTAGLLFGCFGVGLALQLAGGRLSFG
ncbi:hypothetical protein [Halobaculum sp. MBLA0143]|uniref:hypothetical protein n=1 Tax=Halobaculum sp. MBLA0143 TaxID=3079933 RepID=UPI0035245779